MSIYCRKDTGSWMVAYKDQNGKRHDKSFGKGENGQLAAQKFKEEIDKEKEIQSKSLIELDKHDIIDTNYDYANTQYYQNYSNSSNNNETVQSTITLGKLIDEYIEHAYANGCGKYHLYALKRISKSDFLPFFGKDTDITSIDYGKHILPYIRNLQTKLSERGSNLCNISINQYCRYLLAMYNYAVSRGYVIANPMRFWKPLRIIRKERKITFEDACKIMDKACYHIRWAIQLVCYLGVRPGPCELFSLKWSDVDFENMKVRVYASKTNTIRHIDFTDDFANLLHEHRKNSVSEYLVEYR